MKTKIEIEMERTQANVRRLKKELEDAVEAADRAWYEYVNEGRCLVRDKKQGQKPRD